MILFIISLIFTNVFFEFFTYFNWNLGIFHLFFYFHSNNLFFKKKNNFYLSFIKCLLRLKYWTPETTESIVAINNNTFEKLTLGIFLDNSTVYIGKYLGSALYVDAMLHISVPNKKVYDIYDVKHGVIFQPEIGLELDSPFGNIRWNMAPDINALLNNQYVPSTSITLSWKVTF